MECLVHGKHWLIIIITSSQVSQGTFGIYKLLLLLLLVTLPLETHKEDY